jgi:hypothetical protein
VTLVLQAVEVRGPSRWRWLLTDEGTGNPLADHEVALDPDAAEARAGCCQRSGSAWPLELAHAGGVPLVARGDVSLVYAPRR